MHTVICDKCQAEWQLRSSMAHISLQRHYAEVHNPKEIAA